MDIREVVGAWVASIRPSEAEIQLAEKRYAICSTCLYKKTSIKIEYCEKCTCPLSKKIFSKKHSPCPLGYWDSL